MDGEQIVLYHFPFEQALGHPVVQQGSERHDFISGERLRRRKAETDHAFCTPDHFQPAAVHDIGGLARPGGNGANARNHQQRLTSQFGHRLIAEQTTQGPLFAVRQRTVDGEAVLMASGNPANPRHSAADCLKQLVEPEGRKRIGTGPHQHGARTGGQRRGRFPLRTRHWSASPEGAGV